MSQIYAPLDDDGSCADSNLTARPSAGTSALRAALGTVEAVADAYAKPRATRATDQPEGRNFAWGALEAAVAAFLKDDDVQSLWAAYNATWT
eukprot:6952667-Prymnesium_polylepis.1